MILTINRSDEYKDISVSAPCNKAYVTIDTSDWIDKPWMFYELPSLKFEIYTETNGELVKYQNFTREIRTYNPVYSPLGVLNVTIDIRNVPEEFILRITPIFDNNAVAARNMLIENGIEDGDIWGKDQDVPTKLFNLNIEFIECDGEYVPPVPPTHEETITGIPPITFDGSTGEPLVSWTILGNGSQTGTSSPDNIIMPTFCGVRTAQLIPFPYKSTSGTIAGVTVEVFTNGRIKATGTTTGGYNWYLQNASMSLPAGTYTVSFVGKIGGVNLRVRDVEMAVQVAIVGGEVKSQTFTLSEDCSDLRIYLNTGQTGVDIDCDFVVMLNSGSTALPYEPYGWAEKITCGGQTTPVYLGQVQTVRRIKKLVLDGTEPGWTYPSAGVARLTVTSASIKTTGTDNAPISTHYIGRFSDNNGSIRFLTDATKLNIVDTVNAADSTTWTTYLAAQYAAGTPVTVWYVLTEPETAIVNEPLCKIGTYADELSSADADVSIPTAKGQNTLTVETDLQPSSMTITYMKEDQ